MSSRRRFLATLGAGAAIPTAVAAADPVIRVRTEEVSLNGAWSFCLDPQNAGLDGGWYREDHRAADWRTITVPHTWQIEQASAAYMGVAWYRREFDAPQEWDGHAVRVEFEAVFHSATVWLNGEEVGRHTGSGYTAFRCDLHGKLRFGHRNTLVVRADNSFNDSMLPRGKSSDWAHDGGIYRPVQLLVTPAAFVAGVAIDSDPDLQTGDAAINVAATIRNIAPAAFRGSAVYRVLDDETGGVVLESTPASVAFESGHSDILRFPSLTLRSPKLWHFDHPHLYRAEVSLSNGHCYQTTFGIRRIEVRGSSFFLNGERVRLMGVERMAGSNPEFGMAEPTEWIAHDHSDMKELNCVYTRVHWPQDRRVLDWCDRHGILIQTEVPTWGPQTFKEKSLDPIPELMMNGLAQLREMIARDRNHPCIFSWGVCNEVNGQNPPAFRFARTMYEEAKKLDPHRLVTYASNSLQKSPEKDVAGLMDYIMWNEYYESWYGGTTKDLARNLDEIHRAFPDKPIVISEYGYCACTPERPEGDAKRVSVLREHDTIFRDRDYVAGLIFFDYNDYRTHVGDRGTGVMKQRVHGVVDLYGARKPSWEVLRRESSPVEWMRASGGAGALDIGLKTRSLVPSYPLVGYEIRAVAYGPGNIPVERVAEALQTLNPGDTRILKLAFTQPGITRIEVNLIRPTGYSAYSLTWSPA